MSLSLRICIILLLLEVAAGATVVIDAAPPDLHIPANVALVPGGNGLLVDVLTGSFFRR
jgi:hypothetical protein